MKEKPKDIEELYKFSYENKEVLKESKECVCFYCFARFHYDEIKEWVEDQHGFTAQCPKCGIDSVIPANINNKKITDDKVKELQKFYFE